MKTIIQSCLIAINICCLISMINAQSIWVGGSPGKETDWNTSKNWSNNRIPDWSDYVIIPDVSSQSGYFPIIDQAVESIPHLEIQANSQLTILPEGKLTINGSTFFNVGILLVGDLMAEGELVIFDTALATIDFQGGKTYAVLDKLAQQ